jgi:phytoene dehydrogenase-like protein
VACLDVALARLPVPRLTFALGCDAPTYFSVHSDAAALAPEGGALVQSMKYLGEGSADGAEAELEGVLDELQPGWRALVVHRRALPEITVMHAAPDASLGGTRDRPGPRVPGVAGLSIAGDWVGPEGLLLDACLASARAAGTRLLPEVARRKVG